MTQMNARAPLQRFVVSADLYRIGVSTNLNQELVTAFLRALILARTSVDALLKAVDIFHWSLLVSIFL